MHICHGCDSCKSREKIKQLKINKAPSLSIFSLKKLIFFFSNIFITIDEYNILIKEGKNICYLYLNKKPIDIFEGDNAFQRCLRTLPHNKSIQINVIYKE